MKDKDIYLRAQMAMQFKNPAASAIIHVLGDERKRTWAEKRYNKLVHKLKVFRCRLNWVFRIICFIPFLALWLYLDILLNTNYQRETVLFWSTIICAELIIFSWLWITTWFETNSFYIRVKRRGKILW